MDPDTVQTLVVLEEYTTARPELAVASRVSEVPAVCCAGFTNWIVCVPTGVTEFDADEAAPVPTLFVAVTVKV